MKLLQWEENRGRYITEKLQFHCVATESPPRDGSGGLTQVSMFKRWWLASLYSTVSWSVVIWPEHSVEAVCMEPSQTWVGVCFHDPMDSEVRRRKKPDMFQSRLWALTSVKSHISSFFSVRNPVALSGAGNWHKVVPSHQKRTIQKSGPVQARGFPLPPWLPGIHNWP